MIGGVSRDGGYWNISFQDLADGIKPTAAVSCLWSAVETYSKEHTPNLPSPILRTVTLSNRPSQHIKSMFRLQWAETNKILITSHHNAIGSKWHYS